MLCSIHVFRYIEVLIVSFMMSTVTFVVPLMWDNCRDIPEILPEWTVQEISQVRRGRNEEREIFV